VRKKLQSLFSFVVIQISGGAAISRRGGKDAGVLPGDLPPLGRQLPFPRLRIGRLHRIFLHPAAWTVCLHR
jgi:hypothetical protein